MKAFLTGSRTYGTERPDSDIDLVVFTDEQTKQGLLEAQGGRYPIRFGDLNIIAATTEKEYLMWMMAKDKCITRQRQSPDDFDKEVAVRIHDKAREMLGIPIPSEDECPSKREYEAALEMDRPEDRPHKITTPRGTYWKN